MARLPELDAGFTAQAAAAAQDGKTLRYVAELKDGKASVGLQAVPADSALGQLRGNDNLVAFHTRYYPDTPLVLQGRGAGGGCGGGRRALGYCGAGACLLSILNYDEGPMTNDEKGGHYFRPSSIKERSSAKERAQPGIRLVSRR